RDTPLGLKRTSVWSELSIWAGLSSTSTIVVLTRFLPTELLSFLIRHLAAHILTHSGRRLG
ncbi:transposase-like protein, partial [Pyrenophora tritici-repentis]